MPYLPDRPTKSYIHTRLQIGGSKSRSVLSAWWRLTRRAEVSIAIDRNFRSRRSGRLGYLLLCHQLVGEDSPPNLMSVLHIYDLFALPETWRRKKLSISKGLRALEHGNKELSNQGDRNNQNNISLFPILVLGWGPDDRLYSTFLVHQTNPLNCSRLATQTNYPLQYSRSTNHTEKWDPRLNRNYLPKNLWSSAIIFPAAKGGLEFADKVKCGRLIWMAHVSEERRMTSFFLFVQQTPQSSNCSGQAAIWSINKPV